MFSRESKLVCQSGLAIPARFSGHCLLTFLLGFDVLLRGCYVSTALVGIAALKGHVAAIFLDSVSGCMCIGLTFRRSAWTVCGLSAVGGALSCRCGRIGSRLMLGGCLCAFQRSPGAVLRDPIGCVT